MEKYDLYYDIKNRTKGMLYLGVVGPVRTGKSTFIKRFMDLMVLPNMEDEHEKERTTDEMPQSAAGKTIMTTEPKFIPNEAAKIKLADDLQVEVRMIDCVGFMVEGASGHIENEEERMVKTPWFDYEIPFTKAAEIGTEKVIREHSTVGIVVTTDGSFGELERETYLPAEEKTVQELKQISKPFIILLNTNKPYSKETEELAANLQEKYKVTVCPVNCEQLKQEDVHRILESVLFEFPISQLNFHLPKWVEMLEKEHWLKADIIQNARTIMNRIEDMKDVKKENLSCDSEYLKDIKIQNRSLSDGMVDFEIQVDDSYYYGILSDLAGIPIEGEYQLIHTLKSLAAMKKEYEKVQSAIESVRYKGYGVVTPNRDEITLEAPEVIKNGNKYGVKIRAEAPSIHMIQANVLTEIAPIVGSEEQAEDLIRFIKENSQESENGIWDTNIFGKSIEQIVEDGIATKLSRISDETQSKMQDTMKKITNESKGGVICIII